LNPVPSRFIFPLIDIRPDSDMLYSWNMQVLQKITTGGDGMQKNVGSIDRNIRIALGAILLIIGIFAQISTGLRTGAFVVAAIAFVTAFSGF
jgi:hypothetical protein